MHQQLVMDQVIATATIKLLVNVDHMVNALKVNAVLNGDTAEPV